jgi:hypothetical protein
MRHSGPAKQRVWLGPGRYRGRCRDALTNRDADSYANTNSHTCCMRADGDPNTYSHGYSDGHSHSHSYAYTYGNGHSDCKPAAVAYTHVDTEDYANTKASPDGAASPVAEKVTGLPAVTFAEAGN